MIERISGALAILAAVVLAATWGVTEAQAQDMSKMCAGCHGAEGLSKDAKAPNIAGQDYELQEDLLRAYRDGTSKCGAAQSMMCKIAAKLTDPQIEELAHLYSAKPFKAADQKFDAALAATGKGLHDKNCKGCHGSGPKDAQATILHGQWADYLRYAIGQYAADARKQDPMMKAKLSKLSPADIDALVNYYASYR